MVTTNAVLYSRANKEGKYPLAIRITKDRKSSYVFIGEAINKNQWDKKAKKVKRNHPNSTRLNALISKKMTEINKTHLTSQLEEKDQSAQELHKIALARRQKNSFFIAADNYLSNLQLEGKYNRFVSDKPRIRRFKEFLKGKDVVFEDITVSLLKQFKAYLRGHHKVSERTAINYLIVIRTIFNEAIKSNIVEQKYYPFGKNKVQIKFPDSMKIGLSELEVKLLEDVNLLESPKLDHARNVWLISYYLAGVRVSDVFRLRWSDFLDGRLYYSMGKNSKAGSIKLFDGVVKILNYYKPSQKSPEDLVFPELKNIENFEDAFLVQRKISYATKNINKYLKQIAKLVGIDKKLTMHIARHTFGNLSGDRIPIQMLQKLYRHSDVTTTINYQKSFINQDTDDALESVLNGTINKGNASQK
ncbi:MAG: site-specific integrase [Bacteroidota bacterium]